MRARLLQVTVKEIDEANALFSELIGNNVQPSCTFIERAR